MREIPTRTHALADLGQPSKRTPGRAADQVGVVHDEVVERCALRQTVRGRLCMHARTRTPMTMCMYVQVCKGRAGPDRACAMGRVLAAPGPEVRGDAPGQNNAVALD
jgi:hypothetical protein